MSHVVFSHAGVRICAGLHCAVRPSRPARLRPWSAGFGRLVAIAALAAFCMAPAARCASPVEAAPLGADHAPAAPGERPDHAPVVHRHLDDDHRHRLAGSAEATQDPAAPPRPRGPAIAISSIVELQKIGKDPAYPGNGSYYLPHDIDASDTANWNDAGTGVGVIEGFSPILSFTGIFDGQGHAITGLVIDRPGTLGVGLFGETGPSAVIRNVAMVGGSVTGSSEVGALVGFNNGLIEGCSATSAVVGSSDFVGCLVGHNYGTMSRCYVKGSAASSTGLVGGLVGCTHLLLTCCASESTVTATGLCSAVGGLTGRILEDSTVSQCYATGPVIAPNSDDVGGLVGYSGAPANQVIECYAAGRMNASNAHGLLVGGLIGETTYGNVVTSCFWDTQVTGLATSDGGTGLTTVAMQKRATYVGWDFTNTWTIQEGAGYPEFVFFEVPPVRPSNLLPRNAALHVTLTPLLTASAFADANYGDTHFASQWQVNSTDTPSDFSTVLYDTGVTTQSLTSCLLPPGVLALGKYYRFRVRYSDKAGDWSPWSVPTFFRTKEPDLSAGFVVR